MPLRPAGVDPDISDDDLVAEWRYATLLEAGYPAETALMLAVRLDVDLHQAVELLEHGCPLEQAIEILS